MLVMGIDPGLATTGFALLREEKSKARLITYGCVRTVAESPESERLLRLHESISDLLGRYVVEAVAIEKLYFNTNVTTALAVGQARGVIILAAAERGISIFEYTPLQVKQAVAGYGRADKTQVQRMVCSLLGYPEPIRPDDAADAAAIGICHMQSYRFARAAERSTPKNV